LDNDQVAVQVLVGDLKMKDRLDKLNTNIAFQGELIGESVQGNIYKKKGREWRIYDIWFPDLLRFATPDERYKILDDLELRESSVPVLGIATLRGQTVDQILKMAEGTSKLNSNSQREGIVFKSFELVDSRTISFKSISNAWLLKHDK